MKHKVFVNGVNIYDGIDPDWHRNALEMCQKIFRVTAAHAHVESWQGETKAEYHYIGGSLFADDGLCVSAADQSGIKDRVM